MATSRPRKWRVAGFRLGGFLAGLLVTAGLVNAALAALAPGTPLVGLDAIPPVLSRLAELAAPRPNAERRIAFLCDSTGVFYPPGRAVPERFQNLRDASSGNEQIVSLGFSAFHPFDAYFFADRLVAAGPDAIVICVNPFTFSPVWSRFFARPEFASLLEPRRWAQASALPIDWIGLTADRLVFDWSIFSIGGLEAWRAIQRYQARAARVRGALASAVGGTTRPPTRPIAPRRSAWARYAAAYRGVGPSHPTLRALGAALDRYAEAKIPTLVYAVPMDLEALRAFGLDPGAGLARTLRSIETTASANAATFIDLHAIFPSSHFRDASGHLAYADGIDAPRELAAALVPAVAGAIRAGGR